MQYWVPLVLVVAGFCLQAGLYLAQLQRKNMAAIRALENDLRLLREELARDKAIQAGSRQREAEIKPAQGRTFPD